MDSKLLEKLVMEAVRKETTVLREKITTLKTEQNNSEMMEKLKTERKNRREYPKWIETWTTLNNTLAKPRSS